jgi:hypothetical protein
MRIIDIIGKQAWQDSDMKYIVYDSLQILMHGTDQMSHGH